MNTKDTLFKPPIKTPAPFVFDEAVSAVFADMIKRSVPGYDHVINATGLIAAHYCQANTHLYDLGCATGASTLAMLNAIPHTDYHVYAIDNAVSMIDHCDTWKQAHPRSQQLTCLLADIEQSEIRNACVVVLNYTLQFIALEKRVDLLTKIYDGMNAGGVLILSEKLAFESPAEHRRLTALHEAFKKMNGYCELEISQKRTALEKVLIPQSQKQHIHQLTCAGFCGPQLWFRSFNFASFIAWKSSPA